jgi:hypothetical protein
MHECVAWAPLHASRQACEPLGPIQTRTNYSWIQDMKLTVTLEQHQIKNAAMVAAGLNPKSMAIKPGKRVHLDRKKAASRGLVKHKARLLD